MNKLIPFSKFISSKKSILNDVSVIMDKEAPIGFVFGRDSFISFLEHIDEEFEKKAKNPKQAFHNPAGKLIDLIEERLPVNTKFIKEIKEARADAKKMGWISLEDIEHSLNV